MEPCKMQALEAVISLVGGAKQKRSEGKDDEACMILDVALMIWNNVDGPNPRRVICEP